MSSSLVEATSDVRGGVPDTARKWKTGDVLLFLHSALSFPLPAETPDAQRPTKVYVLKQRERESVAMHPKGLSEVAGLDSDPR